MRRYRLDYLLYDSDERFVDGIYNDDELIDRSIKLPEELEAKGKRVVTQFIVGLDD